MIATKLSTENMKYKEHSKMLNLSTLKYCRIRGDMTEVYKIITCRA